MTDAESEWRTSLESSLMSLDDSPVECDGMTFAISHALKQAGVQHECYRGYVRDTQTGSVVVPHLWVVLDGTWIIDLRLRMWLGANDDIPHGVFAVENWPRFVYQGQAITAQYPLSLLRLLTEDRINDVWIEPRPGIHTSPTVEAHG